MITDLDQLIKVLQEIQRSSRSCVAVSCVEDGRELLIVAPKFDPDDKEGPIVRLIVVEA